MKKLAFILLLICLMTFNSFAKEEYNFLNLTGEIDTQNDQLIYISWKNNDNFISDLNEGKISDAFVEFDVKFDQGQYLSERGLEVFKTPAIDSKITLNPFVGKNNLSTDNTLVSIRMRYVYKMGDENIDGEYIEPIVLGHDSYIRNASNWSKKEFDIANKMGLVLSSFKDDVSRPITRYEFIKMLMKLNVFIGKSAETNLLKFEDIDDKDINAALNLGIVKGINGNLFAGENNLTKEEMATIIYRYINIIDLDTENNTLYEVNDFNTVSSWARDAVLGMLKSGIIKGDGNKNINPKKEVTCEEAVVMVIRVLDLRN